MAPPVVAPDDATIIKGDNTPFYYKTWFWLLMLTSLALIVIAIIFEIYGTDIDNLNGIPFWVYAGFAIAIVAYLVAVVLYIIDIRKVTIVYKGDSKEKSVFFDSNNQPIVTQRGTVNPSTYPTVYPSTYSWYPATSATNPTTNTWYPTTSASITDTSAISATDKWYPATDKWYSVSQPATVGPTSTTKLSSVTF